MLPGVALPPGGLDGALREGSLMAVFVPGNAAAVAVGALELSPAAAAAARGGKGRLLTVLHVYRDCLWELAPPQHAVPNEGFTVRP
jgi:predicted ribosome-associated RNA-binding protein Tma20